ncbi:helix-turn-helix domain-containing protein [Alkalicoccus urumqiensis]|uniref:GAF domain-containing protein n=1 Tax=Alkalicoccus urumqiensis TaxID=1548213 RepID=A0A2P6MLP3_ALKUR|nr:helix-turn-helix domain-containing protein [Alkalicoccus urumqiensis]PRO67199.1 hypothetical protein C6I21_01160 [Alkalicoccus urumqiensis]
MNTEKKLMSLIQSARVLTSTLDLDEVLHELIVEVLNVIDGANASVLFLYDENIDKLYAKAAVGFDMNYLRHARLAPGEGMSGTTFSAGKGQMFLSQEETGGHMDNISEETKYFYSRSLGDYKLPTSAISVPLLSKGTCIGVLTVDIYEKDAVFDEQNLHLLETFAAQATIAIENATLFSRNERTTMIHEALSRAAISQGGIREITKTLAGLIHHGVVVYNEFFDILETSSAATKEDAQVVLSSMGREAASVSETEVTTLTLEEEPPIQGVFFPIRSEAFTIGYLTIILKHEENLDPLDRFAIEQASLIFALEMTRRERTAMDDMTHSGYVLDQLLFSEWNEMSMKQLSQLPAFREESQYVVCQMLLNEPLLLHERAGTHKNQLLRLIYREVSQHPFQAFVLDQKQETTFLFAAPKELGRSVYDELIRLFERIRSEAESRYGMPVLAGLGRSVDTLEDIRTSYREAKKCIDAMQAPGSSPSIMLFQNLGLQRLFLNTELQELEDYVSDTIGPLLAYDRAHDTSLCRTLEMYLEENANRSRTARKLFVHVNTVKYRLQVIENLLQLEEISGRTAFELQLGLHIYDYLSMK